MSKIDDIINSVDELIEKRAGQKPKEAHSSTKTASEMDSEVRSLAEEIFKGSLDQKEDPVKVASAPGSDLAKIAHAVAIVDTLLNLEELCKVESFAKTASARGIPESEIEAFLNKRAEDIEFVSVAPSIGLGLEKEAAPGK